MYSSVHDLLNIRGHLCVLTYSKVLERYNEFSIVSCHLSQQT